MVDKSGMLQKIALENRLNAVKKLERITELEKRIKTFEKLKGSLATDSIKKLRKELDDLLETKSKHIGGGKRTRSNPIKRITRRRRS